MSKLDQIRANAAATRKAKNSRPVDRIEAGLKEVLAIARGESKPMQVFVIKRGRPLSKDAAEALTRTKPWLAAGMSRASWYRRQKEQKAK